MSKVFACALVLVFVAGPSVVAASLEYTVSVARNTPTVHVSVVARGLVGSPIELVFRSEASYVSQHVSNLTASRGIPILQDEGRWRVEASSQTLNYEYDIDKVIRWRPNVPWGTSNDIAVYFDNECGILMAPYFFIYPDRQEFTSIRVQVIVPDDWVVVLPYADRGDYYEVQQVTTSLLQDFICRSAIYMGPMEFYSEVTIDGCTIRFGKLERDDFTYDVVSQADADAYVEATAKGIAVFEDLFGTNPYSAFALVTNFKRFVGGEWLQYPGGRYSGNGYQYWPEHRWDELVGHLRAAWIHRWYAPLLSENTIAKGIFENYYGHILAWELYADPAYLGKLYHYYLMYEWMYKHHARTPDSYTAHEDEYETYIRWEFVGLLLDEEIREQTGGDHRLADAFQWLYQRYANTGHIVTPSDLEQAIGSATGVWLDDIFSTYVYNDEQLPVYKYLSDYRTNFEAYSPTFEESRLRNDFLGHTIPFFIEIVLAASLAEHLAWGIGGEGWAAVFAEYMLDHYDIDVLSEDNVTEALSLLTGEDCSDFFTHWGETYGRLTVNEVVAWLHDYAEGKASAVQESWLLGFSRGRNAFDVDGQVDDWSDVELSYSAHEPLDADVEVAIGLLGGTEAAVLFALQGDTFDEILEDGSVEIVVRPIRESFLPSDGLIIVSISAGEVLALESVVRSQEAPTFLESLPFAEGDILEIALPARLLGIHFTPHHVQLRLRCRDGTGAEVSYWYLPTLDL